MSGQRVAYIRVSSIDQNPDRQRADIHAEQVFIDTVSGGNTDRPELMRLIAYVRAGDTVIVHSMDRLARNLDDLRRLVYDLTKRGVKVEFIKEKLVFSGDDSPMAKLLLSVMGAFGEFERSIIRERQKEGIAQAKKRGIYKGRKPALDDNEIKLLKQSVDNGESKTLLANELGITRATIYKYLK
jgi:DNA invertase Pin-like site-specific DNA recombinase